MKVLHSKACAATNFAGLEMKKSIQVNAVLLGASVLMTGCAVGDPHENFVNRVNRLPSNKISDYSFFHEKGRKLSEELLPNGHLLYRFVYANTCNYILEVDPRTNVIVKASYEGERRHCIWNR
jgi:hypothetical protein